MLLYPAQWCRFRYRINGMNIKLRHQERKFIHNPLFTSPSDHSSSSRLGSTYHIQAKHDHVSIFSEMQESVIISTVGGESRGERIDYLLGKHV